MERSDAVYELVRTLRTSSVSRNRNFDAHASDDARAARRILRFLRGVETDVLRAERVQVSQSASPAGGVVLELELPAMKARRTVELDARAHALLVENPAIAERLSGSDAVRSVA